jgi:hypothetical protein
VHTCVLDILRVQVIKVIAPLTKVIAQVIVVIKVQLTLITTRTKLCSEETCYSLMIFLLFISFMALMISLLFSSF